MSSAARKGSVKCCVFCSSVLFCEKKYATSLWDDTQANHWDVLSLTELTDLTEPFGARFKPTEGLRHTENTEASPPAPLRMERGVVCEVTPFGLLMKGDGLLNIWRTRRGISVITPLSIRRGAGGEASVGCKVLWVLPSARALWNAVCSVHLCYSVRKSTHPRYEMTPKQITGMYYLSQNSQI